MSESDYFEGQEDVEGLIFKEKTEWVACFSVNGQKTRVAIDFNPWTGEKLQ